MNTVLFGFTAVFPVFLVIVVGILLRRFNIMNQEQAGYMTRVVYLVFLPALIIRSLAISPLREIFSIRFVGGIFLVVVLTYALAHYVGQLTRLKEGSRGLFSSGSSWSNLAIIGYALGEALYGEEGLTRAALLSAFGLPLHNVLGLMGLTKKANQNVVVFLKKIFLNPLLLSSLVGMILGLSGVGVLLPASILTFLEILARGSLPLALLAIGISLEFEGKTFQSAELLGASVIKLVLMPIIAWGVARALGLSYAITGTMILSFSAPTAVSFFVVSRSLGHPPTQAAAIVTATTLGSALTVGIVAALLRWGGYA